mmetsp:Transcript_85890/g.157264  ORF Transcript_85890/g.157264 Transcript_85890/m.157264 type:complete len:152 (-) Transcript_85890:88-543(-)
MSTDGVKLTIPWAVAGTRIGPRQGSDTPTAAACVWGMSNGNWSSPPAGDFMVEVAGRETWLPVWDPPLCTVAPLVLPLVVMGALLPPPLEVPARGDGLPRPLLLPVESGPPALPKAKTPRSTAAIKSTNAIINCNIRFGQLCAWSKMSSTE